LDSQEEQLPFRIKHHSEMDFDPDTGECLYHYNYLEYWFVFAAGTVRARAYLDTISQVSLYPCPDGTHSEQELAGILAYLRRRYTTVRL